MRVAMMLYAGFQLLEVSGPMDVFQEANRLWGGAFYEQHLVGPSPGPVLCSNGTAVGTTECLPMCSRHSTSSLSPVLRSSVRGVNMGNWWIGSALPGRNARKLASVSNGAFCSRAPVLPTIAG